MLEKVRVVLNAGSGAAGLLPVGVETAVSAQTPPAAHNKAVHFLPDNSLTCNCLDSRKLADSSTRSVFGAQKFDRQALLEYIRSRFLAPRLCRATISVPRSVPS